MWGTAERKSRTPLGFTALLSAHRSVSRVGREGFSCMRSADSLTLPGCNRALSTLDPFQKEQKSCSSSELAALLLLHHPLVLTCHAPPIPCPTHPRDRWAFPLSQLCRGIPHGLRLSWDSISLLVLGWRVLGLQLGAAPAQLIHHHCCHTDLAPTADGRACSLSGSTGRGGAKI